MARRTKVVALAVVLLAAAFPCSGQRGPENVCDASGAESCPPPRSEGAYVQPDVSDSASLMQLKMVSEGAALTRNSWSCSVIDGKKACSIGNSQRVLSSSSSASCRDYCGKNVAGVVSGTVPNFRFSYKSNGRGNDCRCCSYGTRSLRKVVGEKWATSECTAQPIACSMSEWSGWGACSATCGSGTQRRSRTVITKAQYGGKACDAAEDSRDCGEPCPVDCVMNEWSDWDACSATCGSGTQRRSRTAITEAQHGGSACDAAEDSRDCGEPCPVDCVMSEWSHWTACSATCGSGTWSRSRTVITKAQHGGKACDAAEDSEGCGKPCPVDCVMSEWSDWTACSATCGSGARSRYRKVTTPAEIGGKPCDQAEEKEDCSSAACTEDPVTSLGVPGTVMSDGTESKPHCTMSTGPHHCEWTTEFQELCAKKLCEESGYETGSFVAVNDGDFCADRWTGDPNKWNYWAFFLSPPFWSVPARAEKKKSVYKAHVQITAQCENPID